MTREGICQDQDLKLGKSLVSPEPSLLTLCSVVLRVFGFRTGVQCGGGEEEEDDDDDGKFSVREETDTWVVKNGRLT